MWNCYLKQNLNLSLEWKLYSNYKNVPDSTGPPYSCNWNSLPSQTSQMTGEVGFGVTPCWERGWVAWLLPTGGEGVFWLLPTGEVGLMVTSCWGSWVSGLLPNGGEGGLHDYSTLEERVGFYDHFSQGILGFMVTSEKKKGERGNISKRSRKEQRKARLNLYNYVLFVLSGLVPAVGEGELLGYSLLGERVGFYGYFPWRCWFLVTS